MAGEGFLILGLFVIPALVASLSGFAWSLIVEKRNPSARVPGTYALRIVVFIILLVPMVLSSQTKFIVKAVPKPFINDSTSVSNSLPFSPTKRRQKYLACFHKISMRFSSGL